MIRGSEGGWRHRRLLQEKRERREHKLLAPRADFLDLRWSPLPGARGAPGADPRGSERSARSARSRCLQRFLLFDPPPL
eukprot:8758983-Pyramimonas_sp.AAC.1